MQKLLSETSWLLVAVVVVVDVFLLLDTSVQCRGQLCNETEFGVRYSRLNFLDPPLPPNLSPKSNSFVRQNNKKAFQDFSSCSL